MVADGVCTPQDTPSAFTSLTHWSDRPKWLLINQLSQRKWCQSRGEGGDQLVGMGFWSWGHLVRNGSKQEGGKEGVTEHTLIVLNSTVSLALFCVYDLPLNLTISNLRMKTLS